MANLMIIGDNNMAQLFKQTVKYSLKYSPLPINPH